MSDEQSSGFAGWDSNISSVGSSVAIPASPTAEEIEAENLAAAGQEDAPDELVAFRLEDLAGVLQILRLVKLYTTRETRQRALDMLAQMGLGNDPKIAGVVRAGMYRPSPAEQLLADYAATGV